MKHTTRVLAALALLLGSVAQAKASVIDIPGNGTFGTWGPRTNQSWGQSFTVLPGDTVLNDYTLTVGSPPTINPLSDFLFVSQVYAWNGSSTIGSALFTSSVLTIPDDYDTPITFFPDIAVTPGQQYIAFVTNQPNGVALSGSGYGYMLLDTLNNYSGGGFFYTSGNPDAASTTWSAPPTIPDAAFHADFSSVPEPSSLVAWSGLCAMGSAVSIAAADVSTSLVAWSGLCAMGLIGAWRRRKRAA